MTKRLLRLVVGGLLLAAGCAAEGDELGELKGQAQALNACEETVPADRQIDGIPAYAQCSMFESSAIYSNNGVDTSTTKLAADWVQTQPDGGYQCTELAHRYWLFRWQVRWLPRGNAGTWCDAQPPATSGVVQSSAPMHGDLVVLAPGSCGADSNAGHVAVVDVVDSATQRLTVVEQNRARRGTYQQSCARCFLHVIANQDGMAPDAGIPLEAGTQKPRQDAPLPPVDASARGDALPMRPGAADASASADAAPPPDAGLALAPDSGASPSAPMTGDATAQPSTPAADVEDHAGCSVRAGHSRGSSAPCALTLIVLLVEQRRRRRRASRITTR